MSAERQLADVDLPSEQARYQSSLGANGRFRIFDRRADDPGESFVEADLRMVVPVGPPEVYE